MDKKEQSYRFNNNLMMPNINIYIYVLPTNCVLLSFTLHPICINEQCEIMARVEESAGDERYSEVAPSHTLALRTYKTIELDCIILLFAKLFLPNIVYYGYWSASIEREIPLPHLNITICKILRLSELLKKDSFYLEYKNKLGVDLLEEKQ